MIVCMNAATGGITEWDLDWLGLAVDGSAVFGITETALAEIDEDGDEEVTGVLRLGELDFGAPHNDKRVPRFYIDAEHEEPLALTVEASGRTRDVSEYEIQPEERTVRLQRGVKAPRWSATLSGNFSLDALGAVVEQHGRG